MPQTIYLPPDQRWQAAQQAVGKTSDFLYDLIRMETMQGYRQENLAEQLKIQKQENETQREHDLKTGGVWQPAKEGQKPIFTYKGKGYVQIPKAEKPLKKQAQIEQYEYALSQFQKGLGKDPGSFNEWYIAGEKAGAQNITIGEKLSYHRGKAEISADVKRKAEIDSPNLKNIVSTDLSKNYKDWSIMDSWTKEELIFQEIHRRIQQTYPNQNISYDEMRRGWYDVDSGKLLKKYDFGTVHRSDKKH